MQVTSNTKPSSVKINQINTVRPAQKVGLATDAKTVDVASNTQELHGMRDGELNQQFSQQSDEQLKAFAESLDPAINHLTAPSIDERTDLFNHLSVNLDATQSARWQNALSAPLKNDFQQSLVRFSMPIVTASIGRGLESIAISSEQFQRNVLNENRGAFNVAISNTPATSDPVLLSELDDAIHNRYQNDESDSLVLIDATYTAVSELQSQGVTPVVLIDNNGRLYQRFLFKDRPIGVPFVGIGPPPGGYRHGDSDLAPVKVLFEDLPSDFQINMANSISEQWHAASGGSRAPLLSLEAALVSGETENIIPAIQVLDAQQVRLGSSALVQQMGGQILIHESAVAGALPTNAALSHVDGNNEKWFDASALDTQSLIAAGQHIRVQALRLSGNDAAEESLRAFALEELIAEAPADVREQLLDQSLILQREIQLFQQNSISKNTLIDAMLSTHAVFEDAGIEVTLQVNGRGDFWLPNRLRNNLGRDGTETELTAGYFFGSPSLLSDAELTEYAVDLLESPVWQAGRMDIHHFAQFAPENPNTTADLIQALHTGQHFSQPQPDEPNLAEAVQTLYSRQGADSASSLRRLSSANFTVANHLLTQSASGLDKDTMIAAFGLVNAEGMDAFGFSTTERVHDGERGGNSIDLGPYGNLGKAGYQFAQAWLNTSREDRLAHLGLDSETWSAAEGYISQGITAEVAAREAEFGLDDGIRIVAAVGVSIALGGPTSAFVGTLLPASTSLATASFLTGAAVAGVGAFSSTFILTGDLEASLKSGSVGALTGGFGQYLQSLGRSTVSSQIANAITQGVVSELNGQDFTDGVLDVVANYFGAEVESYIGNNFNEFLAGFSGSVTRSFILTGGDPDQMENILVSYVENFAAGQVQTFLNSTVGPHSRTASLALSGLADTVIRTGGDINQIEAYIEGGDFLASIAPALGDDIVNAFGGEESLKAQLLGDITTIILVSNGDPELIEQRIGALALSFAGDWAESTVNSSINGFLGTDDNPLVQTLGTLLNVGISSGWDSSVVSATAYGPVLDDLVGSSLQLLPNSVGGAEGFVGRALEVVVTSFADNNGDTEAIARDFANFIGTELGQAVLNDQTAETTFTELKQGDTGERVAGVQQVLIEQGYLSESNISVGYFGTETANALYKFQGDQVRLLQSQENQPPSDVGNNFSESSLPIGQQITDLLDEQHRGVVGEETINLIESTLNQVSIESNFVELKQGDTGERVVGIQQSLIEHGYLIASDAEIGLFDAATVEALTAFQHAKILEIETLYAPNVPISTDNSSSPVEIAIAEEEALVESFDNHNNIILRLNDEKTRGVVGIETANLLESNPLIGQPELVLTLRDMYELNGNPQAIQQFVESQLHNFENRSIFYQWAHELLNGPGSVRQTDFFLAASNVNEADALGTIDDFIPNAIDIVEDETREFIDFIGNGLGEQNVQTIISLYFGEPISALGVSDSLTGLDFDLTLVDYEQNGMSVLIDEYFVGDLADDRQLVMDNLNDLLNYRGRTGDLASIVGDRDTVTVVKHFWPNEDFDFTNVEHRIKLGRSMVKINAGVPWR